MTSEDCYEPHSCARAFDLGIIVQSSNKNDLNKYNHMIEAVSEMAGRLNVNRDQVHVGLILNSEIVKQYSSLRLQDQKTSRFLIDKIRDLPYIPYPFNGLNRALDLANKNMFSLRRDYLVSRVALILVESKTNPKEDLTAQINELKRNNVQVIVVGVSKELDTQELNALASDPSNVFTLSSPIKLFEILDQVTSSVCSAHAIIKINQLEEIILKRNDIRYFKADLTSVKSGLVVVELFDLEGYSNIYFSFDVKHPNKEDSKNVERMEKKLDPITQKTETFYYIFLPDNAEFLYMRLISYEKSSIVTIKITEF